MSARRRNQASTAAMVSVVPVVPVVPVSAGGGVGAVVGGDVGHDERDRAGVDGGTFQREGELVALDGAPSPRPRVGRDRVGLDADPAHDGVRVLGPSGRGILDGCDLRPGQIDRLDPCLGRDDGVGAPHRGIAFPIEQIRVGHQVWARDLETGTNHLREVAGLFNKHASTLMTITVSDGAQVIVTEEHLFHVAGQGWVLSGDLHVGDPLTQRNHTTTTITTITRAQRDVTVYNFEVTGNHNYYITNAQLLVHNCSRGLKSAISKATAFVRDGNSYIRVGRSQGVGEFRIFWGNTFKKWKKTTGFERAVTRVYGHVSLRYGGIDLHTSTGTRNWTLWKRG